MSTKSQSLAKSIKKQCNNDPEQLGKQLEHYIYLRQFLDGQLQQIANAVGLQGEYKKDYGTSRIISAIKDLRAKETQ